MTKTLNSISARKWFEGPRRQIELAERGIDVVSFALDSWIC